jgi:CHASE1-domain containing sensor protein
MAALADQQAQVGLGIQDGEEVPNDLAISTLSAWRALGLGTSPASPRRNLLTAQRAVERIEQDWQLLHAPHRELAQFYPFR